MKRSILSFLLLIAFLFYLCPVSIAADYYCITVYLDGSKETCGDGSSPEHAVNSLAAAYACLNENLEFRTSSQSRGHLILSGDVFQEESLLPMQFHKGKLTISSIDDSVLHIGTPGGDRLYLQFPGPTVLKDLTLDLLSATQKAPVTVYAGTDFTAEESFTVTRRGETVTSEETDCYLNLRGGYRSDSVTVEDISLRLYGGTYRSVTAGSDRHSTGDVELILDQKASVSVFLECGAVQSQRIGDIHLTLGESQQLDTVYLYTHLRENADATMGSLTMDIYGNISSFQVQRNDSAGNACAVRNGDITVNLHPGGSITALETDYSLEDAHCYITGDATLNVFSYDGRDIYGPSRYDRVVLLGKDATEYGDLADGISLYGYVGNLGLELDEASSLNILGNSDVSYVKEFPADLSVTIEEGSVLRLSRDRNLHLSSSANGNVVFLDTPEKTVSPVVWIDFEGEETLDRSSFANHGEITGIVEYAEGYDGGTALSIHNSFGKNAENYLTVSDMNGVNFSQGSYTVLFQYKALCGGMDQWSGSGKEVDPNIGLDFSQLRAGGILLSAGDFTLAHLPQNAYLTAKLGNSSAGGIYHLQDSRWHMIAVTLDQKDKCRIYVDDTPVLTFELSDTTAHANDLILGADAFGAYGLGNGLIDDLKVYPAALTPEQIAEENLYRQSRALIYEILRYGKDMNVSYSTELLSKADDFSTFLAAEVSADQLYERYKELRIMFHTALEQENESYDLGLALISDVHIGKVGDAYAQNLSRVFDDFPNIPGLNGIVIPGDFADNSTKTAVEAAFDSLELLLKGQDSLQVFAAYGNHEVRYISDQECFNTGAVQFWEELQPYISGNSDARLDSVCNYSYAMTFNGYHFLILNTDNPGQYGNAASSDDPNADPIRRGMYFEEATLRWIEKLLYYYDKDEKPVFVIGHFPFADSVPFSGYSTDPLKDNSIGDQGPEIADIFARHNKLIYICGHLHSGLGISGPVTVKSENGGCFTQVNLPSLKASPRGYMGSTASWYLFASENKILLRARDFDRGEWLTEYDALIHPFDAADCQDGNTCPSKHFSDVPDQSWYHQELDNAIHMGWIKGMSENTFEPDTTIDRAMLVTVLYRAVGEPGYSLACTFTDVLPNSYYYDAVCWAAENGIVKGVSETEFAPTQFASREMIAVILHRMAKLPKSDHIPSFTDSDRISAYAREALAWAATEKIFTGYPDGSLRPGAPMSRAQLVTVLVRCLYLFIS